MNDIVVKQVGLIRQNLNDHDVFALDDGLKIYQINGPKSDKDERVCFTLEPNFLFIVIPLKKVLKLLIEIPDRY